MQGTLKEEAKGKEWLQEEGEKGQWRTWRAEWAEAASPPGQQWLHGSQQKNRVSPHCPVSLVNFILFPRVPGARPRCKQKEIDKRDRVDWRNMVFLLAFTESRLAGNRPSSTWRRRTIYYGHCQLSSSKLEAVVEMQVASGKNCCYRWLPP